MSIGFSVVSYGFWKLDTWESSRNNSRCNSTLFCRCILEFSSGADSRFCHLDGHKHDHAFVCDHQYSCLLHGFETETKGESRRMNFKRRKGVIPERKWKPFSIQGKVYSDEYKPARHFRCNAQSFVVSMNPAFVEALCPFEEKRVVERLVKDSSGRYFVIVEGVDGEGICQKKDIVQ
jgi:hypothetical protein